MVMMMFKNVSPVNSVIIISNAAPPRGIGV